MSTPADYVAAIKSAHTPDDVAKVLVQVLTFLQDNAVEDPEKKEAVIWALFSIDGRVLPSLRKLGETHRTHGEAADAMLFYIGDAADVSRVEVVKKRSFDPIKKVITGADVDQAVAAVKDHLDLPEGHFTRETLHLNEDGTKAYVRVTVGPKQPFQCAGWGLMFHKIDGVWKLTWVRFEWIS